MVKEINQYWENYKNIYSFEEILRVYREKKVLGFLKSKKPETILEIGCGFTPTFLKYNNFKRYILVEPGEKAYQNILEISKNDNRITCFNNFFEDVKDFTEENFDYIIATGVLHETNTPQIFLKNIFKLMHNQSEVYINVPNANSFHRVLAKEMGLIKNVYEKSKRNLFLEQVSIFDKDSLEKIINETIPLVKIKECKSFFIKPFTHDQMMEGIKYNIFDDNLIDGLNNMSYHMPNLGCELYCILSK